MTAAGVSYKSTLPSATATQIFSKSRGGKGLISISSPSPPPSLPALRLSSFQGVSSYSKRRIAVKARGRAAINGTVETASFEPYSEEMDVVAFLDPPFDLIPLDPNSYNPAAYLWKKIEDVPEERRHRLLQLLNPRWKILDEVSWGKILEGVWRKLLGELLVQLGLISIAWEIAGTRYNDSKFAYKTASDILSSKDAAVPFQIYNCRTSGGPFLIAWMKFFKKAVFRGNNGKTYGRFIGGSIVSRFANQSCPLYFETTETEEVMSTEQPCDYAYKFGDGLFDLDTCPSGFPKPVKHPYPFSDEVVIYIRHIGPDVLVGQAWQEGKKLDQVPQKLCGEILMVKQYVP